jgi:hypothetical protein
MEPEKFKAGRETETEAEMRGIVILYLLPKYLLCFLPNLKGAS